MYCATCNLQKLCCELKPSIGYLCTNGHMQCNDCDDKNGIQCGMCGVYTASVLLVPQPQFRDAFTFIGSSNQDAEGNNNSAERTVVDTKHILENSSSGKQTIDEKSNLMGEELTKAMPQGSAQANEWLVFPKNFSNSIEDHAIKFLPRPIGPLNLGLRKHYLRTHEPLAAFNYFCPKLHHPKRKRNSHFKPVTLQMESAGVHTDSAPSLNSAQADATAVPHGLYNNQDYIVMHSTGIGNKPKILDTCQEDGNDISKPTKDQQQSKPETDDIATQANSFKGKENQQTSQDISNDDSEKVCAHYSHVCRAVYKPVHQKLPMPRNFQRLPIAYTISEELPMQFEKVSCSLTELTKIMPAKANPSQSISEAFRHLPQSPFQCPETGCSIMLFKSDFKQHFKMHHSYLPKERITVMECKNIMIDPCLEYDGNNNCHYVYYLKDQLPDQQLNSCKHFLPLAVMSSCVSFPQSCDMPPVKFFVFWVTGFVPEKMPIYITLSAWPRGVDRRSKSRLAYSGKVYSIRKSQAAMDVVSSGQMLMLSQQEVLRLTNKYRDMMNIQLMVEI